MGFAGGGGLMGSPTQSHQLSPPMLEKKKNENTVFDKRPAADCSGTRRQDVINLSGFIKVHEN